MKNRKILKNILCFLIGVVAFAIPIFFSAGFIPVTYATEISKTPIIKEKDISIVINVQNNGTLSVTEKSTIVFGSGYTEYLRDVPYVSEIIREEDGIVDTKKIYAKISNVSGERLDAEGDVFNVYKDESGYEGFLSFGLKSTIPTTENEERTYQFKYDYYMGDFKTVGFEGLYYNILGSYVSHERQNINFEINMPKEYKKAESPTRIYFGVYGQSTELNRVSADQIVAKTTGFCDNSDTKIVGYIAQLSSFSAVTIETKLDSNYFAFPALDNTGAIVSFVVILSLLIIGFALYMIKQKPEPLVTTVEVLPPNKETSAMIEALYKEKSTSKGISSMIVYFASKKLLNIMVDSEVITLVKQKDITQDFPAHAQHLFNALFIEDEKVQINALSDDFYNVAGAETKTLNDTAITNLYGKNKKSPVLLSLHILPVISIIVFMIAMASQIKSFTGYFMLSSEGIVILTFYIVAVVFAGFLCRISRKWWTVLIVACLGGIISMIAFFSSPVAYLDSYHLFAFSIVLLYISLMFVSIQAKLSKKGKIIKGQVCGFKNYLVKAEKPMLEMLVKETPSYFYDILPYTYALGVSDVWMNKFKDIVIPNPDFISVEGVSVFDVIILNNICRNLSSSVEKGYTAMRERMQNAGRSEGGFSDSGGGGFAGGGGGGGGGHAR
ncbi:MAG: DUF2207 domain-containing protein [Clostridia bacterium]